MAEVWEARIELISEDPPPPILWLRSSALSMLNLGRPSLIQALSLLLIGCLTSNKLLDLSEPLSHFCKMEMIVPVSKL